MTTELTPPLIGPNPRLTLCPARLKSVYVKMSVGYLSTPPYHGSNLYNFFKIDDTYEEDLESSFYHFPEKDPEDNFWEENGPKEINESLKEKSVDTWTKWDVTSWMISVANDHHLNLEDMELEYFGVLEGRQLIQLSEFEFELRCKRYGKLLYKTLHDILDYQYFDYFSVPEEKTLTYLNSKPIQEESIDITIIEKSKENFLESEDSEEVPEPKIEKKRPGRPRGSKRRPKTEKLGRLWEFIRDLLKNPEYCPSLIVWENYEEGMFRFVHSDKVAKLWGTKKGNPDMNYEKLSRAMRYYYPKQVFLPVYGRRLVYKFGPKATGWKVKDPNFTHS